MNSADLYEGGRKRIFIGLLCASCAVVCLAFFLLLILPWMVDVTLLGYISIGAGCLGIAILAWLCLSLVFCIHTGRKLPGITSTRHLIIRLMLPLMEAAGKYLGFDKKLVRRSFIKINNEFVLGNFGPVGADKILLLLPHCIQSSQCPRRLAYTLDNCAKCGQCQIGLLIGLAQEKGIKMAIATGGTIARRIVVECRPERIIAVACERDLSSGIQDSYPIPVFGVLNKRPNGPCKDTLAPLATLEQTLDHFIAKRDSGARDETG